MPSPPSLCPAIIYASPSLWFFPARVQCTGPMARVAPGPEDAQRIPDPFLSMTHGEGKSLQRNGVGINAHKASEQFAPTTSWTVPWQKPCQIPIPGDPRLAAGRTDGEPPLPAPARPARPTGLPRGLRAICCAVGSGIEVAGRHRDWP